MSQQDHREPFDFGELLRGEVEAEVEGREGEWTGFTGAVLARLEAAPARDPEAELVDHAARDLVDLELLAPELEGQLFDALRAEARAEEASRDWSVFAAAVEARITAEEASQTFTVGALLREEAAGELASREGQWSAFTAGVLRQVATEVVVAEQQSLADQAVGQLRAEVEAEVQTLSPRFEEGFREEVERRIWRAAQRPSLWARLAAYLQGLVEAVLRHKAGFGLGWAATAAAVLLLVLARAPDPVGGAAHPGQVTVDQVSFEGTVVVMPEDGLTVVWLVDPSS